MRARLLALLSLCLVGSAHAAPAGGRDGALCIMTATDREGSSQKLVFGVLAGATSGFDSTLGERPLPPPPPVPTLELRFMVPSGRGNYPQEASYVDIRPYGTRAQRDTFLVRYQAPPSAYPIAVTWESDIREKCDSMLIVVKEGSRRKSMVVLPDWKFIIPNDRSSSFTIILYGPRVKDLPSDLNADDLRR